MLDQRVANGVPSGNQAWIAGLIYFDDFFMIFPFPIDLAIYYYNWLFLWEYTFYIHYIHRGISTYNW